MPADLIVSEPFRVPFRLSAVGIKCIDAQEVKAFWEKEEVEAYRLKQGVYVFASRSSRGYKPIYVGKAGKSFKQECFTPHKLHHYAQALSNGDKGTPVMFFIAPAGKKRKIRAQSLTEVEDLMIQFAVAKNPDLRNKVGTKAADWSIRGVVRGGKGKRSKAATSFSRMMGIGKSISG